MLLSEARSIFPGDSIDCVLSTGTGMSGPIKSKKTRRSILRALKKMATNSCMVHDRVAEQFSRTQTARYFRFDVTHGLEDVILSDWKKSSQIAAHTKAYLADVVVLRRVEECAGILCNPQNQNCFSVSATNISVIICSLQIRIKILTDKLKGINRSESHGHTLSPAIDLASTVVIYTGLTEHDYLVFRLDDIRSSEIL